MKALYDPGFYDEQKQVSRDAAEVIVPLVNEVLRPTSVIDFGCGVGEWLAVWKKLGVNTIVGVEAGGMTPQQLAIPPECIRYHDLTKPFPEERRFDLAMSLEVAEHLPKNHAGDLVRLLTTVAPVVLFSAAIPFQGGVNHFNEQWPEYWAALFESHSFRPVDFVRRRIWTNRRVAYQYAQNILLFMHRSALGQYPILAAEAEWTDPNALARVHPVKWIKLNQPENFSLMKSCSIVRRSMSGFIARRLLPWRRRTRETAKA